jgi:hypothetical protein
MVELDIGAALDTQECKQEAAQAPPPEPLSKELGVMLKAIGTKTCVSKSASGCASYDAQIAGGFAAANAAVCAGYDEATGCESIAANYQKTLSLKNAISCAIKQTIESKKQSTTQVNTVKLVDVSCFACGCAKLANRQITNQNGETEIVPIEVACGSESCCTKGTCPAINSNQTNDTTLIVNISFSENTSSDITTRLSDAITQDLLADVKIDKEGVGTTPSGRQFNVGQVQSIMNENQSSINQTVRDSLLVLEQKNEYTLEGATIYNYLGSCINVDQFNVIDVVLDDMFLKVIEDLRSTTLDTDLQVALDALADVKGDGTDIGKGADAKAQSLSITGLLVVLGIGFIVLGGAYLYMRSRTGKGGSEYDSQGGSRFSPKIMKLMVVMFVVILLTSLSIGGYGSILKPPDDETPEEKKKRQKTDKTVMSVMGLLGSVILVVISIFIIMAARSPLSQIPYRGGIGTCILFIVTAIVSIGFIVNTQATD